jgi:putative membrane protein
MRQDDDFHPRSFTMRKILALGAAALFAVAPTLAWASPAGPDFIPTAIKGDTGEIMMGHLAQTNGGTEGVRNFGKTLVTDHTKAKHQMENLAKKMNIDIPSGPAEDLQSKHGTLATLHGAAFDQAFLEDMVQDYTTDIAAFTTEANGNDGATSTLAKKQLPVLKKHLHIAQSLQNNTSAPAQ